MTKRLEYKIIKRKQTIFAKRVGPTEIRTRVVGFKVQSDSHYTIGPRDTSLANVILFDC